MKKKIYRWLALSPLLNVPRKYCGMLVWNILREQGAVVVFGDKKEKLFEIISNLKKEFRHALTDFEYQKLDKLASQTEKIPGDIAEVGVYRGGSAKILCETTKKQIHLFDTFSGLPETNQYDSAQQFEKGDYSADYDDVKNFLKEYPNVHMYKGLFPSTADPIKNKKFSLVHLDTDLHASTLNALHFFYPRMNNGGVIISHDYTRAVGVQKAFDDFFLDKPEIILSYFPGSSQCFVIKV